MTLKAELEDIMSRFDDESSRFLNGEVLPIRLAECLGLAQLIAKKVRFGVGAGRADPYWEFLDLLRTLRRFRNTSPLLRKGLAYMLPWVIIPALAGDKSDPVLDRSTRRTAVALDEVNSILLKRAWKSGLGPSREPLVIDLCSTTCGASHIDSRGSRCTCSKKTRSNHPLFAFAADSRDLIASSLQSGHTHTDKDAANFVRDVVSRARQAGAGGQIFLQADEGFASQRVLSATNSLGVFFSIELPHEASLVEVIDGIKEDAWEPIPDWDGETAHLTETRYSPPWLEPGAEPMRLIVRRVPPIPSTQLAMLEDPSYLSIGTNRKESAFEIEADHRQREQLEKVLRRLRGGKWLQEAPFERFAENAIVLAVQTMDHNCNQWAKILASRPDVTINCRRASKM